MEGGASEVARPRVSRTAPATRILLGMIAGAVVTIVAISLVDSLVTALFPLPPELGLTTVVTADRAVASMPLPARLLVVLGWCAGAFAGGAAAAAIVGRRWAVWPMAALTLSSVAASVAGFAHPLWMIVAGLILPWPSAAAARRFAHHR